MSYSSDIKQEICKIKTDKCCKKAELYGFLLFSKLFTSRKIVTCTEHEFIILRCEELMRSIGFNEYLKSRKDSKYGSNILEVNGEHCLNLFLKFQNCHVTSPLRIDYPMFECESCMASFIRGVFNSCGFISDPKKAYHLEIQTTHQMLADDLIALFAEFDLPLKSTERKGKRVLYLKSGEQICDFLAIIGAKNFMFDFTNTQIEKGIINRINREMNCENANMDKNIKASMKAIKAVNLLKDTGYDKIPEPIIEMCEIRLKNPDFTVEQLGNACDPPISKSGAAHRLKKIFELAEKLENKE